ncbi:MULTISPECIES: hypothetical protein [Dinoroseobacter]|uniref:hypothetical protein n=1 Tax=Dinoroseobacter TaxID=309512 RepID=UPI0005C6B256|nr:MULTISPECIES: hypothetical protein [Dinoroseobacter]MDD9716387.1 hypothetical protein [Dinoroseobacter sp. PD6]URF45541.1 hypothetical protein M8008_12210 [Dinoroseobacter shibae]URF49846.1 hypothetical protein M8007_12210 [Dinoroseobacter shibae]
MTMPLCLRPGSSGLLARLREVLRNPRAMPPPSTEFDRLNALSDAELQRMGLTRSVLRRHLHQKRTATRQ